MKNTMTKVYVQPQFVEDIIANILRHHPGYLYSASAGHNAGNIDLKTDPKVKELEYVIKRPDYTRLIDGSNLFRTSIHVDVKPKPIETVDADTNGSISIPQNISVEEEKPRTIKHHVHISNIPHTEENMVEEGIVVVFETMPDDPKVNPYSTSVTRTYISDEALMLKKIKIGNLSRTQLENDILNFLNKGQRPE